jgi:HSP20 family protein
MAMSPYRGRGFYDVQSEMNRIFDEMFGGLATRPSGRSQSGQPSQWAPPLDVVNEDGDIVVRAELPGVRPEDVDVTLSRGVLTIQGERKAEEERQGTGYYVRERRHGTFRRSMQLPEGVDESSISARFEHGVLEVRIKGGAAVQEPKRIQVEAPSGGGSDGESSGGGDSGEGSSGS